MEQFRIDIKKNIFTVGEAQYNLFDLPKFISLIKNSLEKDILTSTEIEKEYAQLSIIQNQSCTLVQSIIKEYQEIGIFLN